MLRLVVQAFCFVVYALFCKPTPTSIVGAVTVAISGSIYTYNAYQETLTQVIKNIPDHEQAAAVLIPKSETKYQRMSELLRDSDDSKSLLKDSRLATQSSEGELDD